MNIPFAESLRNYINLATKGFRISYSDKTNQGFGFYRFFWNGEVMKEMADIDAISENRHVMVKNGRSTVLEGYTDSEFERKNHLVNYLTPMELAVIMIALTDPEDEEVIKSYYDEFLKRAEDSEPSSITGPLFSYSLCASLSAFSNFSPKEIHEMALLGTRADFGKRILEILD